MTALKVAFLHPDLGIGGAERWLVDTALGLQRVGNRVVVYVGSQPQRSVYDPTRDGHLPVRVCGGVPYQFAGRLRGPLSVLRMWRLIRLLARDRLAPDVVVVDLVAHAVPLARRLLGVPVVYYCHYPDSLLAPRRTGPYRPYRWLLDTLERRGLEAADLLVANSRFTAGVLHSVLPRSRSVEVLTPAIDPEPYQGIAPLPSEVTAGEDELLLLSVSRFEPGKGLERALDALAGLRGLLDGAVFRRLRLVFAGGLDRARPEQAAVLDGLRQRSETLGLGERVAFAPSCSDGERMRLLAEACAVVYTPSGEHFGLVPLEAMAAARPLVAVADGGLMETVIDGHTGLLCPPDSGAFAGALARILTEPGLGRSLGSQARRHVQRRFSLAARAAEWDQRLRALCASGRSSHPRPAAGRPT